MKCLKCQTNNSLLSKFCSECGYTLLKEIFKYCNKCQQRNDKNHKFCTNCGSKLINKLIPFRDYTWNEHKYPYHISPISLSDKMPDEKIYFFCK